MHRRRIVLGAVSLVLVTALATFGLSAVWFSVHPETLSHFAPSRLGLPASPGGAPDMALFWDVYSQIKDRYVDAAGVKDDTLVAGAISGMVQSLGDPYSMYLDPTHLQALREELDPGYSGIGVVVDDKEVGGVSYVTVVAPMKGSPGERAGLMAGDRLIKVGDVDLMGKSATEAVKLIRGPKGTKVRLTVVRGEKDQFTEEIVREEIPYPTVDYRMLPDHIGYIHLYQFNQTVGTQIAGAVKDLKGQGARGMVLDMRQDPGGLLEEAVAVGSDFLPKGRVVSVVYRDGSQKTYDSDGTGLGMPLVVLVDGGTASAAEIVAGAIKDRGAGTLVGSKTFGKGSVQTLTPLANGGGLRLTIAKYLTPAGISINKVGIEPDVKVELVAPPKGQTPPPLDDPANPQMMKAIEILKSKM